MAERPRRLSTRATSEEPRGVARVLADLPGEWRESLCTRTAIELDGGPLELSGLPELLQTEVLWLICWQQRDGKVVRRQLLARLLDALRWAVGEGRAPGSVCDWSLEDWNLLLREHAYLITGQLPRSGWSWAEVRPCLDLPVVALAALRAEEWWRTDRWHLRCDARIPRRSIEPKSSGIDWTRVRLAWLREVGKRFAGELLNSGEITWSTLSSKVLPAVVHFDRWLDQVADAPALFDPAGRLLEAPHLFNAWVAERAGRPPSRRQANYHLRWVACLIGFAARTTEITDAPWGRATDLQASAWLRAVVPIRGQVRISDQHFIDDATLARVVQCLHILGAAPTKTFSVQISSGEEITVSGFGDPQAMRMVMLQILTGRRASEVRLILFDCLSPPTIPQPEGERLWRFRYAQSKIDGATDTILVDADVAAVIEEQRRFLTEEFPGLDPPYLFLQRRGNKNGTRPYPASSYSNVLCRFSRALHLTDGQGQPLSLSRTHRFRHTKLTKLAEMGLPIHVIQRYAGHTTPTMTMRYIADREEYQEQVFVATRRYRADAEEIRFSPETYDGMQLFQRADRMLPHGYCLLPPLQTCDKGNACLTCGVFVTDESHLETLKRMLAETEALLAREQQRSQDRHGRPMPEDNVWLRERLREAEALTNLIGKIEGAPGAIEGGGAQAGMTLTAVPLQNPRRGKLRS